MLAIKKRKKNAKILEIKDLSRKNWEKALWVIPSRVRKPTGSTRLSFVDELSLCLGSFCCFWGCFEAEHFNLFGDLIVWNWVLIWKWKEGYLSFNTKDKQWVGSVKLKIIFVIQVGVLMNVFG